MILTILLIIIVLACIGALPTWGWSSGTSYGYRPSGLLAIVVVVILIYALSTHHVWW